MTSSSLFPDARCNAAKQLSPRAFTPTRVTATIERRWFALLSTLCVMGPTEDIPGILVHVIRETSACLNIAVISSGVHKLPSPRRVGSAPWLSAER